MAKSRGPGPWGDPGGWQKCEKMPKRQEERGGKKKRGKKKRGKKRKKKKKKEKRKRKKRGRNRGEKQASAVTGPRNPVNGPGGLLWAKWGLKQGHRSRGVRGVHGL